MRGETRLGAAGIAVVVAVGCGGVQTAPETIAPQRCGDVVGAWSTPVDGVRGRIVSAGSRDDHSSLTITVDLQNVSTEPREIHWDGRPILGFVTFRLDDETGAEVPPPPWALGGNEAVGSLREVLTPSRIVRHALGEVLDRFDGDRILHIGQFWARQMPMDGAHRSLRAQITGRAPLTEDLPVVIGEDGEEVAVTDSAAAPRGRAWTGPLELPPICID